MSSKGQLMTKNTFQGIRAHVSGSYRTETLHGKEYIVVPVVALVEGVLTGMSAAGPELALADEFGKFPESWNGRPVVMSHPVNDDGIPISANSPKVLETYQLGWLFNTKLVKSQLEQEAWIDVEKADSLNDDAKAVMEALKKGEMIEVSTGYYALIEPTSGIHNNQKYDAIQRNIAPDHLAFLPIGTLGACSNADGCGAQLAANSSPDKKFEPVKDFRIDGVDAPCCAKCAETGGSCQNEGEASMSNTNAKPKMEGEDPKDKGKKKQDPKAYEATTIANTIAGGVTLSDARDLVCSALKSGGYGMYTYVLAMTTDKVVYETYDNFKGEYVKYQRSYSVGKDGVVTLGEDVEEVTLMTKIVTVNSESNGDGAEGDGGSHMSTDTTKPGETAPAPQANTEKAQPFSRTVTNEQGSLEVQFNEKNEPIGYKFAPKANAEPKKPQTVEEFIAQAPGPMQEVLQSSFKLHESQKKSLVDQIKGTGRCKIADERLNAMSLQELQDIAELAQVPSYEGRALPVAQGQQDDEGYTEAPLVFEAPKAA